MTAVRAVTGGIQVDGEDSCVVMADICRLLDQLISRNSLAAEDVISLMFTAPPGLACQDPAAAAASVGLAGVPVVHLTNIAVFCPGTRVFRVLAHVLTERPRGVLHDVYLNGAAEAGAEDRVPPRAEPVPAIG